MAAFFLAQKGSENLIHTAEKVFEKRGFSNGRRYSFSCGEILIYSKQIVDCDNTLCDENCSLFCVGTVVYKSSKYKESLNNLLSDFKNGKIDCNELWGEFVIIFIQNERISVLTDETRMYKLFSDKEKHFLTSSFMAAAACTECTVNDCAVTEQILCGFVSAPDTLVNEVYEIRYDDLRNDFKWIKWIENKSVVNKKRAKNKTESILNQTKILKKYIKSVSNLSLQYGAECGMSGGCDSRLIYTSLNSQNLRLNSVHTHSTSEIHNKEINVVKEIADLYKTPLVMIPTTFILDCKVDEIDKTLKENVLYFDCRNAETIGSFSQTHTRWYKEKTANKNGVTFSGIGGEIYRNFYYTEGFVFSINKWLNSRVFIPFAENIIPKNEYKCTLKNITKKIEKALGVKKKIYCKTFSKRYFDRYRIPNALSNVVHANNQMSFYLAPFIESKLIEQAKYDNRWQDRCGEYEGKIIGCFNSKSPEFITSKGYNLLNIPKSIKIKWKIRGIIPSYMWINKKNSAKIDKEMHDKLDYALKNTDYFSKAFNVFKNRYNNWNLEPVLNGRLPLNSFMFTVCAFYEISELKKELQ